MIGSTVVDPTAGVCTIYHDGRRVWPPSDVPTDPCTITIYPEAQPPLDPPRRNRHERRRARKMGRR